MTTEPGTWLRDQREARGWSRPEMARRVIAAAMEAGDRAMPDHDTVAGYIYRWERGLTEISDRYRLHFCRILKIKAAEFGLRPAPEAAPGTAAIQPAPVIPAGPGVPPGDPVAYRGIEVSECSQSTVRQEVLMAAHEGSDHAEQAERRDFGDATLEQLHADVTRLSAESMTGDPFAGFLEMRRVRERIYRLLEGHLRPGDQAGLYFLVGCLNDLMAVPAGELGYPQAAEELMRAGWAYATAIDHRPLMGHLRLQMASNAFWNDRPRQARDLAEDGLRYIADGPNAAHLHLKQAKAAARLGDADGARHAIYAARDAGERDHADDVLAIGGEFALSAATQHYYAGSALVEIEGAESEAADEIQHAIRLYEEGPQPGEQHWYGAKAMASIDLATVRLRAGALDAAATAI